MRRRHVKKIAAKRGGLPAVLGLAFWSRAGGRRKHGRRRRALLRYYDRAICEFADEALAKVEDHLRALLAGSAP